MSLLQAEHIMNSDPGHARLEHAAEYNHGSAFIHGQYCSIDAAAIPIVDCGFMHADADQRGTPDDYQNMFYAFVIPYMYIAGDEALITSTAGGIMPVNSVDGIVFGGSHGPGELTTRLHNLYWEKRWDGWLGTPVRYRGVGAGATATMRP